MAANRNKEPLVPDLKTEEDREVLARLVERADVPDGELPGGGVMDWLGFRWSGCTSSTRGWSSCRSPVSGTTAREARRAGYDQIAQGEGGLMSITGTQQPTKVGVPIADPDRRDERRLGVLAALHERT